MKTVSLWGIVDELPFREGTRGDFSSRLMFFFCTLQDVIIYSLLAFLYLFATSLVASAIDYYQKLDGHVTQWTIEQLIVAVVSAPYHVVC